jgi:hypothetical protein
MLTGFGGGSQKEGDHKDIDIGGRIILKLFWYGLDKSGSR